MVKNMIDHVTISVVNITESSKFYSQILSEIGIKELARNNLTVSYGKSDKIAFVISQLGDTSETVGDARGLHIAFAAPTIQAVTNWYSKAIENGAKIITTPEQTDTGFFHALIEDPNGWKLEAIYKKEAS